jgi:hypothetical protein
LWLPPPEGSSLQYYVAHSSTHFILILNVTFPRKSSLGHPTENRNPSSPTPHLPFLLYFSQ